MASYTRLDRAQVEEIVARYPLRLRDASPLTGGAANSSYLLHTETGPYVLTILNNHDDASATRLEAIMEHLVAHGIPTSRPLRTRDGEALGQFGDHPVMIKEYLTGTCGQPLAGSTLAAAGELLARVHAVPAGVVVGGLGLGYTARAVLDHSDVRSLVVVPPTQAASKHPAGTGGGPEAFLVTVHVGLPSVRFQP